MDPKKYIVIQHGDADRFEQLVSDHVQVGYAPASNFVVIPMGMGFWYFQPMMLIEDKTQIVTTRLDFDKTIRVKDGVNTSSELAVE